MINFSACAVKIKEFSPDVITFKPPRPVLRATLPAPLSPYGDIAPACGGDMGRASRDCRQGKRDNFTGNVEAFRLPCRAGEVSRSDGGGKIATCQRLLYIYNASGDT